MSTCCWMASVTFVAMASCTSGECTSGPTVSTYRWVSFSVRWPQYATAAGVVSSAASTTQTTTAIERPLDGLSGAGTVSIGVVGVFGGESCDMASPSRWRTRPGVEPPRPRT